MKNLIQVVVLASILAFSIGSSSARSNFSSSHSTGPYYGGGQHTQSHGGYYYGGVGSSHIGGAYQNPITGNQYGKHQ